MPFAKRIYQRLSFSMAVCLMLVISILFNGCQKEEPRYNRMPIRVYMKRLGSDRDDTVQRAVEAIVAMGKDSTPYILKAYKKANQEKNKKGLLLKQPFDDYTNDLVFY